MDEKELERDHALGPVDVEGADASAGGAEGVLLDSLPPNAAQLRRIEERREGV
jgi:hypothetical protein